MSRRILVTGGSGFIGAAIVKRLVLNNYEVRVLDDNSRGSLDRLSKVIGSVEFIEGSIEDYKVLRNSCREIDSVVHLAYINVTKNFYDRPGNVLDVAIRGMINLADAMKDNSVKELTVASSSEVYQEPEVFPTPEEVPMVVPDLHNPRYSYGLGKIVQEFYGMHAMSFLKNFKIFRPHNIYGPNMGRLHVIPQIIEKIEIALQNDSYVTIEGDGSHTRSFCYIDDFVDAFDLIYQLGVHKNVYNIGTPYEISIMDLVKVIAAHLGYTGEIKTGDSPAGGTSRRVPDLTKINALGYSPSISIEKGIKLCING
jgi:dTDP-glucose 4,6-dehydratase/UDP-glucose 4-epimerase